MGGWMDRWMSGCSTCFFAPTVDLIPTRSLPCFLFVLPHSLLVLESPLNPIVFIPRGWTLPLPPNGWQMFFQPIASSCLLPGSDPKPLPGLSLQAGPEFSDTVARWILNFSPFYRDFWCLGLAYLALVSWWNKRVHSLGDIPNSHIFLWNFQFSQPS